MMHIDPDTRKQIKSYDDDRLKEIIAHASLYNAQTIAYAKAELMARITGTANEMDIPASRAATPPQTIPYKEPAIITAFRRCPAACLLPISEVVLYYWNFFFNPESFPFEIYMQFLLIEQIITFLLLLIGSIAIIRLLEKPLKFMFAPFIIYFAFFLGTDLLYLLQNLFFPDVSFSFLFRSNILDAIIYMPLLGWLLLLFKYRFRNYYLLSGTIIYIIVLLINRHLQGMDMKDMDLIHIWLTILVFIYWLLLITGLLGKKEKEVEQTEL